MNKSQCDGCARRIPLHLGMHVGEQEMFMCTESRYRLELEPKSRDTWYEPGKKNSDWVPFKVGG